MNFRSSLQALKFRNRDEQGNRQSIVYPYSLGWTGYGWRSSGRKIFNPNSSLFIRSAKEKHYSWAPFLVLKISCEFLGGFFLKSWVLVQKYQLSSLSVLLLFRKCDSRAYLNSKKVPRAFKFREINLKVTVAFQL